MKKNINVLYRRGWKDTQIVCSFAVYLYQQTHNVVTTLLQRHDVAATL